MAKTQNRSTTALVGAIEAAGAGGGGDVFGPASSDVNSLARFIDASGKLLGNSPGLVYDGTDVLIQGKRSSRIGSVDTEVFSASDFPAPIAGVITLPSGVYRVRAPIVLSDRIEIGASSAVRFVADHSSYTLTYTGVDTFISTNGGPADEVRFIGIRILLTGVGATALDIDAGIQEFISAGFTSAASGQSIGSLGTVAQPFTFVLFTSVLFLGFATGMTVLKAARFDVSNMSIISALSGSGALITFGIDVEVVIVNGMEMTAGASESALFINPATTGTVDLHAVELRSPFAFFAAGSLDEKDPRVELTDSTGQKSSMNIGSVIVNGNLVPTTITTVDTWTDLDLGGLAVAGSNIELWDSVDVDTGEIRYIGLEPFFGQLLASLSIVTIGGARTYHFRVVKNGVPLPDGVEAVRQVGTVIGSATLQAPVTAVTNDLLRVQVKNVDNNSDVEIRYLSLSVT